MKSASSARLSSLDPVALNGTKYETYIENTTDNHATCALRATVKSDHPHRNPVSVPYASRRHTYCPPVEGNAAPNSAHASAPRNEIAPANTQTAMIIGADGTLRATRFGTRKIPPPIMIPTTIAIESPNESRLASPAGTSKLPALSPIALMDHSQLRFLSARQGARSNQPTSNVSPHSSPAYSFTNLLRPVHCALRIHRSPQLGSLSSPKTEFSETSFAPDFKLTHYWCSGHVRGEFFGEGAGGLALGAGLPPQLTR